MRDELNSYAPSVHKSRLQPKSKLAPVHGDCRPSADPHADGSGRRLNAARTSPGENSRGWDNGRATIPNAVFQVLSLYFGTVVRWLSAWKVYEQLYFLTFSYHRPTVRITPKELADLTTLAERTVWKIITILLNVGLIRLPERKFDEHGKASRGGSGVECLIEVLPLDDRLLEKLRSEIPQANRKSRDNAWRAVARRNIVAPREHKTPQEYCPPIRMEPQHPNAEVSLQSNAEVALQSNAEVAAPFLNTNSNLSVDNVGVGSAVVDRPAAQPDDDERDNTERTAESEVAPPPRLTTPGTVQALARSGKIPASAPELEASREAEICTVVTTLLRFGGGDDEIARRLLAACRMNAPECSAEDVAGAIIFKAASVDLNQIRNTSGFFAVTVPKLFTGETWRQIRADGAPQRPPILSPHAETVLRCMRRMQEER